MRTLILILAFVLSSTKLYSQIPDFDLHRHLRDGSFEDVKQKVKLFAEKNKGTGSALYLEAVIETDAEKAVENYERLLTRFPKSELADDALYRIAQYHFSRGLYVSARRHFLDLAETYPESPFVDDARYFAAACLFAAEKYKSCHAELTSLLLKYPRSPFAKLAKEDLKEIKSVQKGVELDSKTHLDESKGKYTLQIGAFTKINNALNQRNYFSKFGLPVEIREKNEAGVTFYLVWLGAFKTRSAASAYGMKFKKKYGKPYRI
ncbi:MAG: SPOR domain-containing protein, partial [bacterium]